MQAIKAKLRLISLLLLFSGACRAAQTAPVKPTLLAPATVPLISTPTLVSSNGNQFPPPTPFVTPRGNGNTNGGRSIGDSYIPELGNTGYDVQNYTLQLALRPDLARVSGSVTIEAVVTFNNLTTMSLDFIGYEITQLMVNNVSATFKREEKKLVVNLPQILSFGTRFLLRISYEGEPVRESSPYVGFTDALGLSFVKNENIYTLSEPDGARYWFPSNDHPRDKALFRFELTVPIDLTAVANGKLIDIGTEDVESLPGGGNGRTFIWEHNYPMATYLALVAVGPFERIDAVSPSGVPLRHYVTPNYREEFEMAVSITGEALDWMSGLFGAYPFEAFGYIAADLPPTAMETQTMVIFANELIGQQTVVHEMVHMWFGNWVTQDSWSEMWLKEGLATYVTVMWETRNNPEALDSEIEKMLAAVQLNTPQYPIGNPPPRHLLGYNTYFKGAVFVHTLRRAMGDDAFFSGLRTYLQRYGGGTASSAQFQTVMEGAAGFSLESLFVEWLN